MSVIALTSAGGAPGVTTTTIGLACTWPRPVVAVDADPVGGSAVLAGYFRGFQPPTQSVADLVLAARAGRLVQQFPASLIPLEGTASVLPGPRSHAQAWGARELWEPLGLLWKALHATTDVLVDLGRLGMESYAEPCLRLADLVLLVVRSDLPSLAAAKQWAERAAETRRDQPESPEWALLVVGPGRPYGVHEVSKVLPLPVAATLRWDPRGATRYSHGAQSVRAVRFRRDLGVCGSTVRDRLAATARVVGTPHSPAAEPELGTPHGPAVEPVGGTPHGPAVEPVAGTPYGPAVEQVAEGHGVETPAVPPIETPTPVIPAQAGTPGAYPGTGPQTTTPTPVIPAKAGTPGAYPGTGPQTTTPTPVILPEAGTPDTEAQCAKHGDPAYRQDDDGVRQDDNGMDQPSTNMRQEEPSPMSHPSPMPHPWTHVPTPVIPAQAGTPGAHPGTDPQPSTPVILPEAGSPDAEAQCAKHGDPAYRQDDDGVRQDDAKVGVA